MLLLLLLLLQLLLPAAAGPSPRRMGVASPWTSRYAPRLWGKGVAVDAAVCGQEAELSLCTLYSTVGTGYRLKPWDASRLLYLEQVVPSWCWAGKGKNRTWNYRFLD